MMILHAVRPTTATVSERIQVSKDVYMKDIRQLEYIILHQQLEQRDREIQQLKAKTEQVGI